ncbi:hypothetical protein [Streptomyces subrutilus]|uniref:hypothetical protein n=1 Tax=Streptomyces subrutilus TaxID=36818 RepID=UPI003402AA38
MGTPDQAGRPRGRREAGARGPGLTMPQAIVISVVFTVVFVLAVVTRLQGMPMGETFQLLGGAAGIGAIVSLTLTSGGRGIVAAMVRAAVHSGR